MKSLIYKCKETFVVLGITKGVLFLFFLSLYRLLRNTCVNFAYKMFDKKHKIMFDFISHLDKRDKSHILRPFPKQDIADDTIWMFWYQGEDFMPEIVKMCIESVRKHSCGYSVVLLDKDNISDYLDLPVMKKINHGMTYTNFSDYLRLSLLTTYGGIWIDATMFVTDDIKKQVGDFDFYTIKNVREKLYCISEYRWSISFLKCNKDNDFIFQAYRLFCSYWSLYDRQFEYALLDYILAYLVENKGFQPLIDSVPLNNPRTYKNNLFDMLGEKYEEKKCDEILKTTWLHKLAHYKSFKKEVDGVQTFYGKLQNLI